MTLREEPNDAELRARPWMTDPMSATEVQRTVEYVLALLYTEHGPMPLPDVQLAEQALSLVAGLLVGTTSTAWVLNALSGIAAEPHDLP